VLTKLAGIAKVAKERPQEKFTSLAHLINIDMLRMCHSEMDSKKATGVDAVTKEAYSENLEDNLEDLVNRMKRHAYQPQPVRRVYIPKPGTNKLRPLGIPMVYSYCTPPQKRFGIKEFVWIWIPTQITIFRYPHQLKYSMASQVQI